MSEDEFIPNYHRCLHKEIRNGVEFCHFHDKEIHTTLAEHDAALIAQEREKWERELRVDAQNPWCYPGCILVDKAKAQAREDVLREIDMRIEAGISALHEQGVDGSLPIVVHEKLEVLAWVRQIVEFLRPGQEREPE